LADIFFVLTRILGSCGPVLNSKTAFLSKFGRFRPYQTVRLAIFNGRVNPHLSTVIERSRNERSRSDPSNSFYHQFLGYARFFLRKVKIFLGGAGFGAILGFLGGLGAVRLEFSAIGVIF
jgi:hypothetical protein